MWVPSDRRGMVFPVADITDEWFVGFADGEGCFTIRIDVKPPNTRRAHLRFEVNQALRDSAVVEAIHAHFGFGRIDYNTSGGRLCQWRVLRQADTEALVDLFDRCPLRTIKRFDYAIWRRAVYAKRRMLPGPAAHGDRNAALWAELIALRDELAALRSSRRALTSAA
jgi:hypothetical protein